MKKQIAIFGGGTVSWIRNHLALSAPAYGGTARRIANFCEAVWPEMDVVLYLTKMANCDDAQSRILETNEDISKVIDEIVAGDLVKVVFFTCSVVDFKGSVNGISGLEEARLNSKEKYNIEIEPAEKLVSKFRTKRKDIFLVAFKQTHGATEDEQYIAGLNLCKSSSCNLVLANDTKTGLNMVVTPEEARYHVTKNRAEALTGLIKMTQLRSHLTFTRSTVVAGEPVSWNSPEVPESLRAAVNFCIQAGAYKPFRGSTVGHFACKLKENEFLTSIRRSNFNDIEKFGLVRVITDGPDTVLAYGAKPSVGGQSQRIIFKDHPEYDCILHFHCPKLPNSEVPVASQYEFECGSMACGENTSNNLKKFGNLSAVYLDKHGPNIVFHRSIDPQEVIDFVKNNFDLSQKTGGFVTIQERLDAKSTLQVAQEVL